MDIAHVLDIQQLGNVEIISGENGIQNKVSNVTFVDAPDGFKWCKEEDFIITSGFFLAGNKIKSKFLYLLNNLVKKKCAGIGIKTGRYIDSIPTVVKEFSNKHKIPILSLPNNLSWSNIYYPIVNEINKNQQKEIQNIHYVYKEFEDYLKKRRGTKELLNILEKYFPNNHILIYLRTFDEFFKSYNSDYKYTLENEEALEKVISDFFHGDNSLILNRLWHNRNITIKWLLNSDILEGGIFIIGSYLHLTSWQKAAIEQSAVILSLQIEQRKNILSTFQQFRNEFLSDLFNNNIQDPSLLYRRSKEMGLDVNKNYKILLMECFFEDYNTCPRNNLNLLERKNTFLKIIQNTLYQNFSNSFLGLDDNNYLTLLIPKETDINSLLNNLSKLFIKGNVKLLIGGVGAEHPIINIEKSYADSHIALNVAKSNLEDKIHIHSTQTFIKDISEIGVERILFSDSPFKEIRILNRKHIDPLIRHDNKKKSELLITLKSFMKYNGDINITAANLFVHPNTIRYRLEIIENVTGLQINNFQDLLLFQLLINGLKQNE